MAKTTKKTVEEAEVVEVVDNSTVDVKDTGKSFEIVTACTDPEKLYLDKKNFTPLIERVKGIARGLVADVHTDDGIKARKELNRKLASLKTLLDNEGKKVSDELRRKPSIIQDTRKTLRETIEMLQDEVMAPIKAIEARREELEIIANLPGSAIGCDSAAIAQYLQILDEHVHDEKYWDESYRESVDAIAEARRQLTDMKDAAEKAEKERKELEELRARQVEFERKAREEAEAKQREAEEQVRKAKEAAEQAKREAEQARQEAEAAKEASGVIQGDISAVKRDAEKTKADMLFPDDKKMYKRTCNREALEDMTKCSGITEDQAKAIITAIVKNKVRHIFMMY